MKRKNLFLSLICSLILTVALVTVTVISLVPKKDSGKGGQTSTNVSTNTGTETTPGVNEDKDGSAEKPYVIYSVDSFKTFVVDKYLDENGEYVDYNAVDEEGNLIYPELNAGLHYVLDSDIDFANTEFETIFNKGIAFNGHIDGAGHTIKNINITVTKDNLVDTFAYTSNGELVSNVGVFGELNGAVIENVTFDSVKVQLEEGLYEFVWSADFKTEKGTMKSISVGSIAGLAKNSTIKANVVASLDAFAYSVYVENRADGLFAVGGVVASAVETEIADSKVDVDIIANQGAKYFVGGVAGSSFGATISNVEVDATVATEYQDALYIAGAVGYAKGIEIKDSKVTLEVKELGTERFATMGVSSIDNTKFVSIAGVIHTMVDSEEISVISNVEVKANIDIDGIYAGVVMDAINEAETIAVEITNVIVDSNVNVLKTYGFARKLSNTKVVLENTKTELIDGVEISYNIRLTGKVRLSSYMNMEEGVRMYPVSLYVLEYTNGCEFVNGKKAVQLIVDAGIVSNTPIIEQISALWGGFVKI